MNRLILSKILAGSIGLLCVFLAYNHNKSATYEIGGSIYGTYWKLVSPDYITDSIKQSIVDELDRIDLVTSNYKLNSELSLLNQAPPNTNIKISQELSNLLIFAENITLLTDGAYDVTLGKLVIQAGFGPAVNAELFDPRATKRFVIDENLNLHKYNNFLLDLSSIAKGYAVDKIYDLLNASNKNNFLFDIGGELVVSGSNHGEPWVIGIQNPLNYKNQSIVNVTSDNFLAIATSGEYRNFNIDEQGMRTSHTLNPQTGKSISNDVLSVTVTSDLSSMQADAWATAMNVIGPNKGLKLAEKHDISVLYIISNNDEINFLKSSNWTH
ncbi:MAG: FAD:protein FMN transferase [Gammaproteobacteria bacterium]